MSKIALKLVEEMQLSWDYGQGFHTDSICILWKYLRSVDIIRISRKYPRSMDMICILWIYLHSVDIIGISYKYPRSVDIIHILWIYPHWVDTIKIGHITSYLARNFLPYYSQFCSGSRYYFWSHYDLGSS